jgi:hypothetical protein
MAQLINRQAISGSGHAPQTVRLHCPADLMFQRQVKCRASEPDCCCYVHRSLKCKTTVPTVCRMREP